jgi:outer membrane protein TolC
MKKDIAISDLEYEKAIIQYRQTLYQAFADVENALSNRTQLNQQVQLQQRNVELANKTERLTEVRYRNGAIALKNLLDAQETTRNARLSLVETKQNQYNAYVTLMQALGGSPVKELPKQ